MKTKTLIIATSLLLFAILTLPTFVVAQNIYGMTSNGGVNNAGIIFQYNPSTSAYIKKIDFTGANGQFPFGSLVQASDGNLYGMTYAGGTSGVGVLFQYNPSTSTYTKKLDFTVVNGAFPSGSLIQASDDNLYGMTYQGGTNSEGNLFQFNPSTSTYTEKFDFTGVNGADPLGSLMQASDGNLYGMTEAGGTNNKGVLFQFNPVTSAYTKELDFIGTNGASPYNTNLLEVSPPTTLVPTLSQWAFITLSVLVLGAAVFFVRGRV